MAATLAPLKNRSFLALFTAQFVTAFNDNLYKQAVVNLAVFGAAAAGGGDLVGLLAGGALILPYLLFSATAGQLTDRADMAYVARMVKAIEIPLMALAAVALLSGSVGFMLLVLLAVGVQVVFFGPVKYAVLPRIVPQHDLVAANGLIESTTFVAILLGTIAGVIVTLAGGPTIVGVTIVISAIVGFLAIRLLPPQPPAEPGTPVDRNLLRATIEVVRQGFRGLGVGRAIMGISWFWTAGGVMLALLPTFVRDRLGADAHVFTLFLGLFAIGIMLGTLTCAKLLKGEIAARHVPFAAVGMALCSFVLFFLSPAAGPAPATLISVGEFLRQGNSWSIMVMLFLFAFFGGIFTAPLYAILQAWSDERERARIIGANNIVNAVLFVAGTIVVMLLVQLGVTIPAVFVLLAIAHLAVAAYVTMLLPQETLKAFFAGLLKITHRVTLSGREHAPADGAPAVYICNHVSFLDGALLAAFLPGRPTFAVDTGMAQRWWARPFLELVDIFTVDPTNPLSTKAMIKVVKDGRPLVIFPEGRLTVTGALMKIYEGPGMIADKAGAQIVPVRIDGAQFSKFSRLKGVLKLRWFPKVSITLLPPRRMEVPAEVMGRARRRAIGRELYDVMSDMMFETSRTRTTLFHALLEARSLHGRSQVVVEDFERRGVTYDKLIAGSFVLGRHLARETREREYVGVLLPNAAATMVTFFALHAFGRVPAMLNFATGAENMAKACEAAQIKTVITSRRFVERAKLGAAVERLSQVARFVWLEDLRERIGAMDKLYGLLAMRLPRSLHRRHAPQPDSPAVILFTSGTEGTPKGVVLSHANIMANRLQLASRIDFNPTDVVFNALPVFHSFGLTGGALLPILSGIRAFFYPSPLHYRIVPELVYTFNATILFGTDTFLSGYARNANPYDFYSVRYVFAGAERLKPETRRVWMEKFGIRIFEGYGATETAPVIAANTPMHHKPGTVGRIMPGIEWRLDGVPGVERGGRLVVKGPNVMLGYLRAEKPGDIEAPPEGWYDTGDIVEIDDEGFVTITGRAKRFAKIGGEMVSLAAVETWAGEAWPGAQVACVSLPDPRKGEQLVLLTDRPGAARADLLAYTGARNIPELMVPRTILAVERVPLLATGKIDYRAVGELARNAATPDSQAAQ
jgi:acyl-[acyl-carrier-protein]-phospholipid O-acyltransferase/long-chain-fatty-acid--[acyl-carrier-protein] ligase